MLSEDLIERWWTPDGLALTDEIFAFLRGERHLPPQVAMHAGKADLRGIGVPPIPARTASLGLASRPAFVVRDQVWRDLDLSFAWLHDLRASGLRITDCRFDRASCRYWRLEETVVEDCSFLRADFYGSFLMSASRSAVRTSWIGTTFDGARMDGLAFYGGQFLGCTFDRTRLAKTRFRRVELRNCVFAGPLPGVVFDSRRTADDPPASPMSMVDFGDAMLDSTDFLGCRFEMVTLPPGLHIVEEYPAVVKDALHQLERMDSAEARRLSVLLRPVADDDLEPDAVGVFDRLRYQSLGGEELASLAENVILGSTKESRSRQVEVRASAWADAGARGDVVSTLIATQQWSPPGMEAAEVDLVATSPRGETTLFMVECRPWGTDAGQVDQLSAKVASYRAYVLEGRLARDYPGLVGNPTLLRLECATEPPPDVRKALRHFVRGLQQDGIRFAVHVDNGLVLAGSRPGDVTARTSDD